MNLSFLNLIGASKKKICQEFSKEVLCIIVSTDYWSGLDSTHLTLSSLQDMRPAAKLNVALSLVNIKLA